MARNVLTRLGVAMIARTSELVFPTDSNPMGNLFGGTLVAWMDKTAGLAAMRHARGMVVTAAIDRIEFAVPVHVGDMVEVTARVVAVGRTSMTVDVIAFRESPVQGEREQCIRGTFTLVAVDESGVPTPVPRLPVDPSEQDDG